MKTLALLAAIAAPALAGTADEFHTALQQALTEARYEASTPYSITLVVNELPENAAAITLSDNYYIVNQWHRYWGFNTEKNNEITNNEACTLEVNGTNYTYTTRDGVLPVIWAQNETCTGSGERNAGENLNITIECDGKDTKVTLNYSLSFITDTFVLKGTALDASKIKLAPQTNVENFSITVDDARLSADTQGILIIGGMALCALLMVGTSGLRSKKKQNKPAPTEIEASTGEETGSPK